MRKLASIQQIIDIKPIEGADKIEIAIINGWEIVVKKDTHKIGDKVIYCEIDSLLPEREEFEFLRPKKFKIRTIKLRGQVSQGIIFPLGILTSHFRDKEIGTDLTDVLSVKNYKDMEEIKDSPVEYNSSWWKKYLYRFSFIRNLLNKRHVVPFPPFINKTDEERIQNNPNFIKNNYNNLCVTEKLDGQSATFFIKKNKWFGHTFGVCSRNNWIVKDDDSNWWQVSKKYDLYKKMKPYNNMFIQGEIVGPSIQKNKYRFTDKKFYLFNAGDFEGTVFNRNHLQTIADMLGVEIVPQLDINIGTDNTVSYIVEKSKGYSVLNSNTIREGIVIRKDIFDSKQSVKVINPDFLLKNEE